MIEQLARPWSISCEREPGRYETCKSFIYIDLMTALTLQLTEIEAVPVPPGSPVSPRFPVSRFLRFLHGRCDSQGRVDPAEGVSAIVWSVTLREYPQASARDNDINGLGVHHRSVLSLSVRLNPRTIRGPGWGESDDRQAHGATTEDNQGPRKVRRRRGAVAAGPFRRAAGMGVALPLPGA